LSNACIVDLGDQTLIFDTFLTPQAAIDLSLAAETLTEHPATLIVNSHYHNDHTWGNQVFGPDAELICTEATRHQIATRGADEVRWLKEATSEKLSFVDKPTLGWIGLDKQARLQPIWQNYAQAVSEALPRLRPRPSNLTFDQCMTLHGQKRSVELVSFPNGHTSSDTVLWLPEEGVLAGGDLVYFAAHPFLGEADPLALVGILDSLQSLNPRHIIPGHGKPGSRRELSELQDYLEKLLKRAEKQLEKLPFQDKLSRLAPPAAYLEWMLGDYYPTNLRRAVEILAKRRDLEFESKVTEFADYHPL
jgi:glyoxylase-like metal-dependent hydrolase (beta-lactamase superfamily II)